MVGAVHPLQATTHLEAARQDFARPVEEDKALRIGKFGACVLLQGRHRCAAPRRAAERRASRPLLRRIQARFLASLANLGSAIPVCPETCRFGLRVHARTGANGRGGRGDHDSGSLQLEPELSNSWGWRRNPRAGRRCAVIIATRRPLAAAARWPPASSGCYTHFTHLPDTDTERNAGASQAHETY
jgi:hypothetical protein